MFECQYGECSYKSNYKSNIKKHMFTQHNLVYIEVTHCHLCNLDLGTAGGLETHRKKFHPTLEEIQHKKNLRKARNRRYYLNKKHGN